VSKFTDRIRARVLSAVTGAADGRPDWVRQLELGDDAGFFGPDSAAWVVHGGLPTFVAGIRALLLQTLHPGAMAGVHDWSMYREDPLGRLSRTVRWLVTVTFSDTKAAARESNRIDRLHERVVGTYPGSHGAQLAYSAQDPELLDWVHAVFTDSFLTSHLIWGGPIPGGADAYVLEWAKAGELVGVLSPPRSRSELHDRLDGFRAAGVLRADERVARAVGFLRTPGLPWSMATAYRILFAGAVASIDAQDRAMLGLHRPWWPAITATRAVLWGIGLVLGSASSSELAARARLARLALE
jgi:uncharacterized protein (DUF2236 family)